MTATRQQVLLYLKETQISENNQRESWAVSRILRYHTLYIKVKAWCWLALSHCCVAQVGLWERSATGLLWDRFIEKHLFSISSTASARCSHWDLRQILRLTGRPTPKRDENIEQRKKNTSMYPKRDLGIHLTFKLLPQYHHKKNITKAH